MTFYTNNIFVSMWKYNLIAIITIKLSNDNRINFAARLKRNASSLHIMIFKLYGNFILIVGILSFTNCIYLFKLKVKFIASSEVVTRFLKTNLNL